MNYVKIKRKTKPDEIGVNGYCVTREEYDKAMNDDRLKELIKSGNLKCNCTKDFSDGTAIEFMTIDLENVYGTITEITDDYISIIPSKEYEELINELVKSDKIRMGMRYITNRVEEKNGIKYCKDIKIITFDIIMDDKEDKYYE